MSKPCSMFDNVLNFGDKHIMSFHHELHDIMWWTGLKDRIGTDIYEGDILFDADKFNHVGYGDLDPCHRVVVWDAKNAKFSLNILKKKENLDGIKLEAMGRYLCQINCHKHFKVVGNIYNPPGERLIASE